VLLNISYTQVHKFKDMGAKSINEELLSVIHSRSSGSPMFLEKLSDTLRDYIPPVLLCDEEGVVHTANALNYDDFLAGNVESAIIVSFDRLEPLFQDILRVAAIFGQVYRYEIS
jgi:hypothetical protein